MWGESAIRYSRVERQISFRKISALAVVVLARKRPYGLLATRPIARLVYKRGGAHFPTPQTILAHCKSLPCFTDGMESDDKDTNWQHAGLAAWRCLLEANKKRREYRAELLGRVRTEQVKVRGEASPTKGKRRL